MATSSRMVRMSVGVAALVGLALAGCSSDKKSSETTAKAATTTAAAVTTAKAATTTAGGGSSTASGSGITIKDFAFDIPSGLKAGATVTVTNEDGAAHTFTDQGGKFSVAADPGKPSELTLPAAGTYTVICNIHPGMEGTLTVE